MADRICDDVHLNVSRLDCIWNSIDFMNLNTKVSPGIKNKGKRNKMDVAIDRGSVKRAAGHSKLPPSHPSRSPHSQTGFP